MASIAAAARSTVAAARHVALGIGRLSPLFPQRGFAAGTTLPRPLPSHDAAATPSAPRGRIRDGCCYNGSENYVPICWLNPEAPVDPATYVNYGEEDLASEEAMWALYERWCAFFGVKRDRDDMLRRFGAFKDRARSIHEFNHSGASYTRMLTSIADYTEEERVKYFSSLGRGPC